MTRAQTLKVSRSRLIETLRKRLESAEVDRERLFREALAEKVAEAQRAEIVAMDYTKRLKEATGPEDLADEYWTRPFRYDGDLVKQIRLLELSDEETIAVGPTSNLWAWL